ncbi:MAG: DNA alkylation repair protein [Candidatus Nanoarchaeia archaeon]
MNKEIENRIHKQENKEKAKHLMRFFKTGPGQYGEGDIFLGIVVPKQREIVKEFKNTATLEDIKYLLDSNVHEKRLIALLFLIEKYKIACKEKNENEKKIIFDFYLKNTKKINNWDLVDLSAPNIVGDYLLDKERKILYSLAKSENLWEKRIAIISTLAFIRKQEFKDSLKIASILLYDKHDLIHKAVGWMLREIGKREQKIEEGFLKENKRYKTMPRTMLRYAIERFDEKKRKKYLNGEI